MARTKVDDKLNVVIGTKAQVEADNTIPDNSIVIVTDEELTASDIPNLDAEKITTGTFGVDRIPPLAPSKITQDANNRFVTDAEKATWNGKGDAYLANPNTFTGVNTFTQNVNLNRSGFSTTDPALTFNIGQNGAARIRVLPETNPEQSPTTFRLIPTYLGGDETLLHTGNVKTINNQSILGSGNIAISGGSGGEIAVETWDTATKTLALSDSNKLFKCSHTSNQTLTIPTNATVAFPIGTMITFLLTSTNAVTFSGASGVTLTSIDGLVELATQYGMASLIKVAVDTWQLVGALE